MNASQKIQTLAALLNAAKEMVRNAGDHLTEDADVLARGDAGQTAEAQVDFAVGSMLDLQTLATSLQNILAAARSIQAARS